MLRRMAKQKTVLRRHRRKDHKTKCGRALHMKMCK